MPGIYLKQLLYKYKQIVVNCLKMLYLAKKLCLEFSL